MSVENDGESKEMEVVTSKIENISVNRNNTDAKIGSDAVLYNKFTSPDKPIEFMPPTEGTPAAQALAANAAIKVSKVSKGYHKLRGLKRPKMKSLNLVRKLNKTTKTKRERKHFSTNFKGKVIDGVHELYTLTAGMMLGIRYSIGRNAQSGESDRVEVADFNYVEKVIFPPKGNTVPPHITPMHSLAHTFKFKTYSPKVFKRLRDFFGIDAASYMISVCGDYNFIEFISNSKSGQFFFYSHDGKYMIKTQTKEENKFMKRILPHYYRFLTENPHSMLVQILGMHRVKMYHLRRKVHFVIMASVFDSPAQINTIYDLKGSLIGRSATKKERETGGVLKDNDLIEDKRKLHLGVKKARFVEQLEKDAMFLASLNIMDYSLLVGIHDRKKRIHMANFTPGAQYSNAVHTTEMLTGANNSNSNAAAAQTQSSRSNTPFRRSIHIAANSEGSRPASLLSTGAVESFPKDNAGPNITINTTEESFDTPVKASPGANESPSRKIVKRMSSRDANSSKDPSVADGTPRRMKRLSSKQNSAPLVAGAEGSLNGVSHSEIILTELTEGTTVDSDQIGTSNDISILSVEHTSHTHQLAHLSSMHVHRGGVAGRRLKKTFSIGKEGLMVPHDSESAVPHEPRSHHHQHHSHTNHHYVNNLNTNFHSHAHHKQHIVQHIDVRRRSSSSSADYVDPHGIDLPHVNKRGSGTAEADLTHYVVMSDEEVGGDLHGEHSIYDVEEGDEEEYSEDGDSGSDYEEDEDCDDFFLDEGDSNVDEAEALESRDSITTVEWTQNNTVGHTHTRDSFNERNPHQHQHHGHNLVYTREVVQSDGVGAMGPEGSRLSEVVRPSAVMGHSDDKKKAVEYTYGPGATTIKPWTSRKDGGINAHGAQGREDEIYFIGIIDILQQYNLNKKVETAYKGLTHDVKQISSVDPATYARRFVKFMDDNID